MAYPQNFLPWQQTRYTAGPFGAVMDQARDTGPTTDQDLLNQTYDAQQSLLAITKASRLKHLTDLNMALRRMGQAPGGDGTYAVAQAERNPYPGIPGNPMTTGFGMPSAPSGIYPGGPVAWTPPLSAAQQMARARPMTAASLSPYPRYNSDGSLPSGILASGSNPRLDALRNITRQISQDEIGSLKDSLYTPLEPYLSPFERQLALAQARGGSERAPNNVNVGGANAAALAAAAARGTTPTANATLTDNRVRSNNDTKQAEQLIYNGGITTQAQLQDQFPDADWNRLGALLNSVNRGKNNTYATQQGSADLANQSLDEVNQPDIEASAEKALREGTAKLPWFGTRSTGVDENGEPIYKPEYQALLDQYHQSVLDPQYQATAAQVEYAAKPYPNQIQYDQNSGAFAPILSQPSPVSENPSGYISRQDMPGQNFHTDLQRSPAFNGLPIVRTQADYNSLPLGAQAVTGDGQVLPPKGGRRGGPSYATGYRRSGGDEFAQDFADAGYADQPAPAPRPVAPAGKAIDFGGGMTGGPRMMSDGTYVVADPSDLVYVPAGATFIGPDGIRRQKH